MIFSRFSLQEIDRKSKISNYILQSLFGLKFCQILRQPFLNFSGILRLDKCFVTAQHDDAEVIKVKTKDDEEAKDVKLVPGMDQISKLSFWEFILAEENIGLTEKC